MAKIYKLSTYIVDPDETIGDDGIEEVVACRLAELFLRDTEIQSSESFEWDDNLPVNKTECTKEELEEYFKYKPIPCDCYRNREVKKPLYNRFTGEIEDSYTETEFYCTGTKECETCNCYGDKRRCTFYKYEDGRIKTFIESNN